MSWPLLSSAGTQVSFQGAASGASHFTLGSSVSPGRWDMAGLHCPGTSASLTPQVQRPGPSFRSQKLPGACCRGEGGRRGAGGTLPARAGPRSSQEDIFSTRVSAKRPAGEDGTLSKEPVDMAPSKGLAIRPHSCSIPAAGGEKPAEKAPSAFGG